MTMPPLVMWSLLSWGDLWWCLVLCYLVWWWYINGRDLHLHFDLGHRLPLWLVKRWHLHAPSSTTTPIQSDAKLEQCHVEAAASPSPAMVAALSSPTSKTTAYFDLSSMRTLRRRCSFSMQLPSTVTTPVQPSFPKADTSSLTASALSGTSGTVSASLSPTTDAAGAIGSRDVPTVLCWLPWLGHTVEMALSRPSPITFLLNCQRKYGNVFRLRLPGRSTVIVMGGGSGGCWGGYRNFQVLTRNRPELGFEELFTDFQRELAGFDSQRLSGDKKTAPENEEKMNHGIIGTIRGVYSSLLSMVTVRPASVFNQHMLHKNFATYVTQPDHLKTLTKRYQIHLDSIGQQTLQDQTNTSLASTPRKSESPLINGLSETTSPPDRQQIWPRGPINRSFSTTHDDHQAEKVNLLLLNQQVDQKSHSDHFGTDHPNDTDPSDCSVSDSESDCSVSVEGSSWHTVDSLWSWIFTVVFAASSCTLFGDELNWSAIVKQFAHFDALVPRLLSGLPTSITCADQGGAAYVEQLRGWIGAHILPPAGGVPAGLVPPKEPMAPTSSATAASTGNAGRKPFPGRRISTDGNRRRDSVGGEFNNVAKVIQAQNLYFDQCNMTHADKQRMHLLHLFASTNTIPTAFWCVAFILNDKTARDAILEQIHQVSCGRLFVGDDSNPPPRPANVSCVEHEPWSKSTLDQLSVLDSAITETLRLCGASTVVARVAKVSFDLELGSDVVKLKGGDQVIMPTYELHMDPQMFGPDPKQFVYDRFLPPVSTSVSNAAAQPSHSCASTLKQCDDVPSTSKHTKRFCSNGVEVKCPVIPFGGGPSQCPGRFLARNEIKLLVIWLLTRLEIDLLPMPTTSATPAPAAASTSPTPLSPGHNDRNALPPFSMDKMLVGILSPSAQPEHLLPFRFRLRGELESQF